jgi:4-methyl-5(b-hydroxyethyl)-thiazole monophosphate biosynthesis
MLKSVLVPVADGTEEIEAVTIIDVLRRAGAQVTVASVGDLQITGSRGVKLVADTRIADCVDKTYDLVVLPGGIPGAEHLRDDEELRQILQRQQSQGRLFGAICAAPAVVLETHGLLQGRAATCHPNFAQRLSDPSSARSDVVFDQGCVTSRGPGTAMAFSLKLVELLYGKDKMEAVAEPMVIGHLNK